MINEDLRAELRSPDLRLCVIVSAMNEAKVIARTVKSILNARMLPSDVYVIDDGSKDGTGEIAASFGVNVLRNEKNTGKANAIARACSHFDLIKRYDIITLMDADTMVNEDYYREVRKGFYGQKDVALVCGRAKSVPYNWLTAYRCFGYFVTHFVYREAQSNMGVINVAPGCAASYRSDVFAKLDWNRETLVEDMDVTLQVHRRNLGKIVYRPKAEVYTQDPRTLADYVKQMNRWYTGTWQIGLKYKIFTGWKKLDLEWKLLMGEGMFFGMMLILFPYFLFKYPMRMLWLTGCDFLITFALAVICGISERRLDVVLASPAYVVMRFVDCGVLFSSFWKTIIVRERAEAWFSVKRY